MIDFGVQTKDDSDAIFQFNKQLNDASQKIGVLERAIAGPFLTILTALLSPIDEVSDGLKDLVTAIKAVGVVLGTVAAGVAIGFAIATSPVLIFIGVVGAAAAAVAGLWALLHYGREIPHLLGAAFGVFFTKMKEWGGDVIQIFKDLFGWAGKIIQSVENFSFWKKSSGPTSDGKSQLDQYNQQEQMLRAARGAINGAASSPLSRNPGVSGSNSANSSVQIGSIVVHTQATDAEGIASAIGGNLQKHINFAINNFNTSVLA